MDEQELRQRWIKTLPELDLEGGQPGLTYQPRADDDTPTLVFNDKTLPMLAMTGLQSGPFDQTVIEPTLSKTVVTDPEDVAASAQTNVDPAFQPVIEANPTEAPGSSSFSPSSPQSDNVLFQIIAEIGKGGMGAVYRARQKSLQREIAVKTILPQHATGKMRQRFISEALITGQLDHPNVVSVHDLGISPGGELVLAMKLVGGTEWKDILHPKENSTIKSLDLEAHLEILLSVCNAIAFAHSKGIVHLDLKPENIMVGEFGEVLVMDWGLALSVNDLGEASPQLSGTLHKSSLKGPAGTPCYMAPELADGRGEDIGRWTDVYLLGAILYELCTGKPPHRGKSLLKVLVAASKSEPPEFDRSVPVELQEICRKAMSREVGERMESVEDFQKAVREFKKHLQANTLITKAAGLLEKLQVRIADFQSEAAENKEQSVDIHRLHTEIQFALDHALEIWPESTEAQSSLKTLQHCLLEHALLTEDLKLATRLLPSCWNPDLERRVEALGLRLQDQEKELATLREQARRLDWSAVAGPLGTVFITAGLLVGLGLFGIEYLINSTEVNIRVLNATIWPCILGIIGGVALLNFRRTAVPDSLISSRMLGSWGAVAAGCFLHGLLIGTDKELAKHVHGPVSIMLGIGLAVMAFQTRRWLLFPALLLYFNSVLIHVYPDFAAQLLASLWVIVLCGIGVAFKMGASLEVSDDQS
jgi:serine/threonine protein kinase